MKKQNKTESKTETEIRLCAIGLGHFGKLFIKNAITEKNVKVVAAFTRTSYVGDDIGDVLNLGYKYNIKVSSIKDLDKILKETKPNICFDAAQTELKEVYNNYIILLNNKVNILSLAEQHVFPYPIKGDYYSKINQLSIDNNVTVFGTGFQDCHFQQLSLSLSSTMLSINSIDVGWYGDFNTGIFIYSSYCGLGLSEEEFYKNKINDPKENVLAHLMKEWTIAMAKWLAKTLGFTEKSYDLIIKPIINDGSYGDVYGKIVNKNIGKGYNLGINITCSLKTIENVDIYFRNELRVYNDNESRNDIELAYYGNPKVRKILIPIADVEYGTITTALNRIPQIIHAKAGYYNVEEIEVGFAKYWKGQQNKNQL
eukprot:342501_1